MAFLLAAALFLPLYPLSAGFNAVLPRAGRPAARFALILLWPQIGVLLLHLSPQPAPSWFLAWALSTSGFYALRLLTVRDLGRHATALATSAAALAWGLAAAGADTPRLGLFTLALTLPAALMVLLDGALARRFGAAHAGLCQGLGHAAPRLAGLLTATTLAAVATPPFPGFFVLLDLLHRLPGAALPAVLGIWLLWGWAAARLLQGFLAGRAAPGPVEDLGQTHSRLGVAALAIFVACGLYLAGGSP
ncbi:MAG TPA: hypothetical protein PLL19_02355 [Thiobacillaceae bacterium]|nr:hypothetical protein [Thiobacillaceae bacterium]HNF88144.1 hypothetical protein [Thiobacillaceae bacterium]HNI06888.1 hypothetical protein [Thiobacillaceae bacterium]